MYKKVAVLDLTGCKYLLELHERIQKALDFPDYYGRNWDAFWDLINRDCDVDFIKIIGESTVPQSLKPHIEMMNKLLEENKQYWADCDYPFDYEIID